MVKIYKRPVYIIEDILHLEIVIGSVNVNLSAFLNLEEGIKMLTDYLEKDSGINILLKVL